MTIRRRRLKSAALIRYSASRNDVDRLLQIHRQLGGSGRGRKWNVEVLNKSAIVLTCAIWEAFVEDLVLEAAIHFASHVRVPDALPEMLRRQVARTLKADAHDFAVWRLAADGWKSEIRQHAERYVEESTGKFNTPKSANVISLYQKALGMDDITHRWGRHRMTSVQARTKLDGFIELRGEIAHRGEAAGSVKKDQAVGFLALVDELTSKMDSVVRVYARQVSGEYMGRID
jgi:hypothetical protein